MKVRDNIYLAVRAMRGNLLRTILTISIIAFGIMALVGIITAITSIQKSIYDNFAMMGANGFSIQSWGLFVRIEGGGHQVTKGNSHAKKVIKTSDRHLPITYQEALDFQQNFHFPAISSVSFRATGTATLTHADRKTDPNIQVIGTDANYLKISGYTLQYGRVFNSLDMQSGRNVAIIGHAIATKLFGDTLENIENKQVRIGSITYRVIGVLATKGSSGFFNADNVAITTINNVRHVFDITNGSFQIGVMVPDIQQLDAAVGAATGTFRVVRKLGYNEENNFNIVKSDSLAAILTGSLDKVNWAAIIIGIITLIGSLIGLMNIMLVAVAERTREIGVSKALGATRAVIGRQFIFESVIISILGGCLGVFLGILFGNVVSIFLKSGFVIPWLWVTIGILACATVGLISGIYPALQAAKLDPIVALRYE
ncbi:MAG: ABC transporter permease [Chitinophagaceae bacterium]